MNDIRSTDYRPESKEKGKARAMASASARTSGKLLGKLASGTMVDVPLAAAEGFCVLPGLYGGTVHEREMVKNWKSGLLAGVKTFGISMAESVIDPLYQPYKGARDGGTMGFAGGIFRGTFGMLAKIGHGIKRSIQATFSAGTRKSIIMSMHEEGQDLVRQWRGKCLQDGAVVEKFHRLGHEDDSGNESDYV
ncbi:UDP-glucuronosyl/UDP-glucosyltransferase [Penicillium angulare]|uniref:UDP-glucuronosyl/UDP-glucosyltransferase n=1 Tax=Penicillium angulare TaxID=116970 RepID=UPI0025422577|nr:UDP-glucuronosyl/UDP-glucosyltransferase [Penicillium angulare]KAJ5259579.1 UDP-glucuronosyl/UDP-glucosyltransferase [Penicillium angulare]